MSKVLFQFIVSTKQHIKIKISTFMTHCIANIDVTMIMSEEAPHLPINYWIYIDTCASVCMRISTTKRSTTTQHCLLVDRLSVSILK